MFISEHSAVCGGLTPLSNPGFSDDTQFPSVTSVNPDHIYNTRDNMRCDVILEENQSTCSTISHGGNERAAILGPGITSIYKGLLSD